MLLARISLSCAELRPASVRPRTGPATAGARPRTSAEGDFFWELGGGIDFIVVSLHYCTSTCVCCLTAVFSLSIEPRLSTLSRRIFMLLERGKSVAFTLDRPRSLASEWFGRSLAVDREKHASTINGCQPMKSCIDIP